MTIAHHSSQIKWSTLAIMTALKIGISQQGNSVQVSEVR